MPALQEGIALKDNCARSGAFAAAFLHFQLARLHVPTTASNKTHDIAHWDALTGGAFSAATSGERAQRVKALEALALKTQQTQLFIETPYRNQALLATLLQTLQLGTRLATSSGLTLPSARNHSADVKTWKARAWALDNATPTVFAIGP